MTTAEKTGDDLCNRCRENPGFAYLPPEHDTGERELLCIACLSEAEPRMLGRVSVMLLEYEPLEAQDDGY